MYFEEFCISGRQEFKISSVVQFYWDNQNKAKAANCPKSSNPFCQIVMWFQNVFSKLESMSKRKTLDIIQTCECWCFENKHGTMSQSNLYTYIYQAC